MCVGDYWEASFSKLGNQKNTLIKIIHQFITSYDNSIDIYMYVNNVISIVLFKW